ncbi:MAG: hypothetical protein U0T83_10320 [Bacteriovoracaceae bacterium]
MGSGKTMYLRSNYAFHLYSLIPNILHKQDFTLPVFIRLSDYQHLDQPKEIYSSIMLSMMKELATLYKKLDDAEEMINLHKGISVLPDSILRQQPYNEALSEIIKLEASEYKEKINGSLKGSVGIGSEFFKLATEFGQEKEVELTTNKSVSIADVHKAYERLLAPYCGRILILFDEAGSLNKSFFKPVDGGTSYFETLMNQLRTSQHIRTKIAIYPQTYSDILKETRYGDVIPLQFNVVDKTDHLKFRKKILELIRNYLSKSLEREADESVLFGEKLDNREGGDIIEQLIYASVGNLRTFVHLLDLTMLEAYEDHEGRQITRKEHASVAISKYAHGIESLFSETEQDFLNTVVKSCKDRGTFKFQFPNMSPILSKYTSKTSEINILNILEVGSGRKGTTYAFDYTYCVCKDIPTHHLIGSQKIDKARSFLTGQWISRVQKLSDEIIQHANIESKISGIIDYVRDDDAFIVSETQSGIFFLSRSNLIPGDNRKLIAEGKNVRFYPALLPSGVQIALAVEMLD